MRIEVWSPSGIPEVAAGDDLASLVADALLDPDDLADPPLASGDIVTVTSKVVSKAEGLMRVAGRDDVLAEETVRVVARRGPTTIVRNHLGLTMAAAGIDASNVTAGHVVLLPRDPDASARALRTTLYERHGLNVGVIITDTAGRAWRNGQTDIAIGAAGLTVAEDFAGREDSYGNPLAVTLPAVADEIAGAAELVCGKLSGRPVAVVRGRSDLVLPAGEHGAGATSLVREEGSDLFGLGARESVLRSVRGDDSDRRPFGAPVTAEELSQALSEALDVKAHVVDESCVAVDHLGERDARALRAVAFAHGWSTGAAGGEDEWVSTVTLRPYVP